MSTPPFNFVEEATKIVDAAQKVGVTLRVLGATAFGIDGKAATYDAERIRKRSEAIGYGIAARQARFPGEARYAHRPQAESGETYRWDERARSAMRDYNLLDLIL